MPFADWGACPFEGCQYGNWTATSDVVAINEPPFPWLFDRQRTGDAFRVRKGEKVFAVTGVVFFTKPGKARIDTELTARIESDRFPPGGGPEITIPAGSTIYLLTPQGEGWVRAWFKGRFVDFDASRLRTGPDGHCIDCAGELLERGQREWWIQLRNSRGVLGWTNQPQLFDGRDALG